MRILVFKLLAVAFLFESGAFADQMLAASPLSSESVNFHVRSYRNGPLAADVLARCDALRSELQELWLGKDDRSDWRPRCEIVLHPSRASYLQAVGRGGGQTSGSSLIQFDNGRMLKRRIDLLVDEQSRLTALPHELTHVVLADRFRGRQPPRWLDEGIATMADSAEKRMLHHRDCQYALRNGTALRVVDMLKLEQFTSAEQVPAFYGQSLSLVHFLAEQAAPGKILDFAETALDHGYDHALQSHYDIAGVGALERQWRDYATTAAHDKTPLPVLTVNHHARQVNGQP